MNNQSARRPYFILNGKSGSCRADIVSQSIERIATEYGTEAHIHILRDSADIGSLVRKALHTGADSVVGGGGDGTINAVAAALVGSEVPLGILPLGTLNHFAKALRVRLSVEDAIRDVFEGDIRVVDVGDVNGHVFLNNASMGLYPRIVQDREASKKQGRPKWLALVQATLSNLKRHRLMHVALTTDSGCRMERATPFLFIGNNRYETSGIRIGSRNRLDEGKLWLSLAPEAGRVKLLGLAAFAVIGQLNEPHLEVLEATTLQVRTRRKRLEVAIDGEVMVLRSPLLFRTLPKNLRVIVPKGQWEM